MTAFHGALAKLAGCLEPLILEHRAEAIRMRRRRWKFSPYVVGGNGAVAQRNVNRHGASACNPFIIRKAGDGFNSFVAQFPAFGGVEQVGHSIHRRLLFYKLELFAHFLFHLFDKGIAFVLSHGRREDGG